MRDKKFGQRKCHGNQHKNKKTNDKRNNNKCDNSRSVSVTENECSQSNLENFSTPSTSHKTSVSSSSKKLSSCRQLYSEIECVEYVNSENDKPKNSTGFVFMDIELLSQAIKSFVQCKYCLSVNCISVFENVKSRKALASKLSIICEKCEEQHSFYTSKQIDSGYEINTRFIYGMRCIGKGQAASKTLCAILNTPSPPTTFNKTNKFLLGAIETVSQKCMRDAAAETIAGNAGSNEISVAIDGSWQKRGFSSLHGVVTAISVHTGKVLDIECLTKYCMTCKKSGDSKKHENCDINYEGSSGGMESEGAVKIFQRSVSSRGVKYIEYLGDGDSKGYNRVVAAKPYGENIDIVKLECVGHVHKRMGSRLRRLVQEWKGRKLEDGKGMSGSKRLTGTEIDKLQDYYGKAIRENTGNIDSMQRAVWATYFHKISTDKEPHHGLCPKDSWCKYNSKEKDNYKHHGLPEVIMDKIKPIYRDLAHKDLLKKCLHWCTQNPNESFNNLIWTRIPKNVFVGLDILKLGALEAVICFNMGNIGRVKVLQQLGIDPGINSIQQFKAIDDLRLKDAERQADEMTKEARKKRRDDKRKREEQNDPEYGAGMF